MCVVRVTKVKISQGAILFVCLPRTLQLLPFVILRGMLENMQEDIKVSALHHWIS